MGSILEGITDFHSDLYRGLFLNFIFRVTDPATAYSLLGVDYQCTGACSFAKFGENGYRQYRRTEKLGYDTISETDRAYPKFVRGV